MEQTRLPAIHRQRTHQHPAGRQANLSRVAPEDHGQVDPPLRLREGGVHAGVAQGDGTVQVRGTFRTGFREGI